jgi:chaperonin GroES
MRLIPQSGRIAVRRLEPESRTAGGLYLPDQSQEKNETVRVMAVCPEWHDEHGNVRTSRYKEGDTLIVSKYAGDEFDLNRGQFKIAIIRESDVLAMIELDDGDTSLPRATPVGRDKTVMIGADGPDQAIDPGRLPAGSAVAGDGDVRPMEGREAEEWRRSVARMA